jgi:hypothetical protein
MKKLFLIGLLLMAFARLASATVYTVTATHLTMHVGDPTPSLIFTVSSYSGTYASLFNGQPTLSATATSASAVGTYPITVSAGSMSTVNGGDSLVFVAGSIDVLAPDGTGANLTTLSYPSWWNTAPWYPVLNVASNPIANLVGDCATDNAIPALRLLGMGRGTPAPTGTVTGGTTFTITSTTPAWTFTGWPANTFVMLDGIPNTITPVSASVATLGTAVTNGSNQIMFLPWWTVSTSTTGGVTTVTATNGADFTTIPAAFFGYTSGSSHGGGIIIAGVSYYAQVVDSTHITLLQSTAPTLTNVDMFMEGSGAINYGPQPQNWFFPPGCYATSQQWRQQGTFWHYWGSGPQSSYIKLLPNSAIGNTAFSNTVTPGNNEFFEPSSIGGNSNFHEFIYGLGIDIGVGNPSAIPFTTVQNNIGADRNMQIWVDDSRCPYAIDWQRAYPGPMMFKNLAVYGCTNAFSSDMGEYDTVISDGTFEGQLGVVFDAQYAKVYAENILSDNSNQFLHSYGSTIGSFAILNSTLLNGGSGTTAIQIDLNSNGYLKNVSFTGYGTSLLDNSIGGGVTLTGNAVESWSGVASGVSLFDSGQTPASLHLPIVQTPTATPGSPSTWTQLGAQPSTWAATMAASCGTVALAPGIYNSSTSGTFNITIPDCVTYINMGLSLGGLTSFTPNFIIAGTSATPLVFDGGIYERSTFTHTGSRILVSLDGAFSQYTSSAGAGNVFLEDSGFGYPSETPMTCVAGQHVWARQLNLEQQSSDKFVGNGCTLWVLGYKTEQQEEAELVLSGHSQAEIFGAFVYDNNNPATHPISSHFYLTDSSLFMASAWFKIDATGYGLPYSITETQSGVTQNLSTPGINSPFTLPMFYSFGANISAPTFTMKWLGNVTGRGNLTLF